MPTLHHQFLISICGCPLVGSEYVTRESTTLSQLDGAIIEKQCYPEYIVEEFHPLINELAKADNIRAAVNDSYYYPRLGFYNSLIDIFFLQDY